MSGRRQFMASFTGGDTLRLQFQDGALWETVGAVHAVRRPACRSGFSWRYEAMRKRANRIRQHTPGHYGRVSRYLVSEARLRRHVSARWRQRDRDGALVHPRVIPSATERVRDVHTLLNHQQHREVPGWHQNTARNTVLLEYRPSVASAIRSSIAAPRFRMAFRRASPSS